MTLSGNKAAANEETRLAIDRGEIPDVFDGDVRAMVLRDHSPEETWAGTVPPREKGSRLLSVACATCCTDWPCASIKAARKVEHSGTGEGRS